MPAGVEASSPQAACAALEHLSVDQLVAVVLRLAMEISALRELLHSHELLLEEANLLANGAVDNFRPGQEAMQCRAQARDALIDGILRDLSPENRPR